ncbi:bHLH1 [Artemisia annua]|uniref:BHLH1 n=1 Tax=Artemisia annua TaxID=35608 RepID=A0A2U1LH83_ARTAN|nr:bHLH1 [Artemisia annua]
MTTSRFVELASILEPEKPPKIDKAAIFVDVVRKLAQLRNEVQKLIDSNTEIQENIRDEGNPIAMFFLYYTSITNEKTDLRDEKQRLKAKKEDLEQKVKSMNTQPNFMIPPPGIQAANSFTRHISSFVAPLLACDIAKPTERFGVCWIFTSIFYDRKEVFAITSSLYHSWFYDARKKCNKSANHVKNGASSSGATKNKNAKSAKQANTCDEHGIIYQVVPRF